MELPYTCDYAKSSRAICRGCQTAIMQDTLRIAIMLPSNSFDGMVPNWYHQACFFVEHMPENSHEIENFDLLKCADQEHVKEIIQIGESPFASKDKRHQLKRAISRENSKVNLKNFSLEYAKQSRFECTECKEKIMKDEIKFNKKKAKKNNWYDFNCFVAKHEQLEFLEPGSSITGFETLSQEDQDLVQEKLPGYCESPPKKSRPSTEEPKSSQEGKPCSSKEMVCKDNNQMMQNYRQEMKNNLKKAEIAKLLKFNGQAVPSGLDNMLDRASDMLTYGSLLRCKFCRGQLVFSNVGYKCCGTLNKWTKCNFVTNDPIRNYVEIPQEMRLRHDFLYKYEFVNRKRIILHTENNTQGPLRTKTFYIHGFSQEETTNLFNKIKSLGGRVVGDVFRSVFCVISTKTQVEKNTNIIQDAKNCEVYVVDKDFLENLQLDLDEQARQHSLVDWGVEMHHRVPNKYKKNQRRFVEGEEEGKRKMKIKNGIAIEPDSLLDHIAHVYQIGGVIYNAVLSKTDVTTNTNSFYKLQLLESDDFVDYWVFYSWGRTGTKSYNSNVLQFQTLDEAKSWFKNKFREMTSNKWENRHMMKKKPNAYMFIDVNYAAMKEEIQDLNGRVADSSLKPAVAQLMAMIFNVEAMQKMMLEYELDLQKMPLGKLSRKQIKAAYEILTEVTWAFQRKANKEEIIAYTNKFYTHMPYASNLQRPPIIDNIQLVKKKSAMLADLLELETAFQIIQREANGETGNPLDAYYNQLKAQIDPLEDSCSEFKLVEEYLQNTHADTHRHYDLKILEVFKVSREGEDDRYRKFKQMENRRLLWHGSRKTNYAGILSQGLRIAPPEAPVTGYMFGKGIYFADMVSKSANYCGTTTTDTEGLLLLCEVALGQIEDKVRCAEHLHKPGKQHNSVRGVGKTQPNPQDTKVLEDGLQVPVGKPVQGNQQDTTLLYNEYIVYDVSQVKIKYLLKVDFKYKH